MRVEFSRFDSNGIKLIAFYVCYPAKDNNANLRKLDDIKKSNQGNGPSDVNRSSECVNNLSLTTPKVSTILREGHGQILPAGQMRNIMYYFQRKHS